MVSPESVKVRPVDADYYAVDEYVELNLRRRNDGAVAPDDSHWKSLANNLLRVISEAPADAASKETADLKIELADHRRSLSDSSHPQEVRIAAAACVKSCEQYLKRIQLDHQARESELTEMVTILREAAAKLVGSSSDFHAQLLSSAGRLKTMNRLDDIRDLKRQLSEEVTSLERVVEDKKKQEEALVAKLSERVEVLQHDLVKAEELAANDPLTKIANRGTFDRALKRQMQSSRASGTALSLVMIDIDHFKKINDTHGHPVGDRVLLCTAEWLRTAVRHTDLVARYGGEEFAVIMVDADLKQAEARFTKVLTEVAGRSYEYEMNGEQKSVRFTVSCGVAQLSGSDTEQELIQRADQALYDAKRKGRNRVVTKKAGMFGLFN